MSEKEQSAFQTILLRFCIVLFLVSCILALPNQAQGQWTPNGNNINNTNSGNVGVNTASPTSRLHVYEPAGNGVSARITIQDADSSAGFNLQAPSRFWSFVADNSPDGFSITSTGGANFFISNTGNVGVGTLTPTSASGYTALSLNNSTGALVDFMTNDALKARLQSDGTTFYFNNLANGPIQIYTNSAERMRIAADGNVGVGTAAPSEKLEVNGNLKLSGTGNITAAGTIEGGNIKAKYQDVAEWVESSQELPAGTVVILDSNRSNQVIASTSAYDSRVAGVISLQPGIALGEQAEGRVLVATTGRVKVKVDASNGPINIGDLLVTSDKTGVAMRSQPVEIGGVRIHRPGTLIGKALEPLAQGTDEILVLLSLQ